jgi:hypothetical protein
VAVARQAIASAGRSPAAVLAETHAAIAGLVDRGAVVGSDGAAELPAPIHGSREPLPAATEVDAAAPSIPRPAPMQRQAAPAPTPLSPPAPIRTAETSPPAGPASASTAVQRASVDSDAPPAHSPPAHSPPAAESAQVAAVPRANEEEQPTDDELDQEARRLYPRIRALLATELRRDRERAGLAIDVRR